MPSMILADEPTGALDSQNSEIVFGILQKLNKEGITVIIVTHDEDIAVRCNRRFLMKDGKIIE